MDSYMSNPTNDDYVEGSREEPTPPCSGLCSKEEIINLVKDEVVKNSVSINRLAKRDMFFIFAFLALVVWILLNTWNDYHAKSERAAIVELLLKERDGLYNHLTQLTITIEGLTQQMKEHQKQQN